MSTSVMSYLYTVFSSEYNFSKLVSINQLSANFSSCAEIHRPVRVHRLKIRADSANMAKSLWLVEYFIDIHNKSFEMS